MSWFIGKGAYMWEAKQISNEEMIFDTENR